MILMDLKIMVLSVEKSNRLGSTAHHPACQLKRMQTKHNSCSRGKTTAQPEATLATLTTPVTADEVKAEATMPARVNSVA